MKKDILLTLLVLMFFCLATPSYAAQNDEVRITTVENQNQVKTQNQGEDVNLKVTTNEKEGTEGGSFNRSQTAVEHMSTVATEVQKLLEVRTSGGIGEQIRVIAQEQNRVQEGIKAELNKIDSRGQFKKLFFGTDLQAVKSLNQFVEQNRLRIEQLTQLQDRLVNQSDITTVEETIQTLTNQNTALQEIVDEQSELKSVFGWLIKLFTK